MDELITHLIFELSGIITTIHVVLASQKNKKNRVKEARHWLRESFSKKYYFLFNIYEVGATITLFTKKKKNVQIEKL